jgi:hypothetical protein
MIIVETRVMFSNVELKFVQFEIMFIKIVCKRFTRNQKDFTLYKLNEKQNLRITFI